jgi:hypothetical protein
MDGDDILFAIGGAIIIVVLSFCGGLSMGMSLIFVPGRIVSPTVNSFRFRI